MKDSIKVGDIVFYSGEFFVVEWIDDSGQTDLVGLKDESGINKVISFSEEFVIKPKEEWGDYGFCNKKEETNGN